MVDITVLSPSLGYGRFIEDNLLSVLGQEGLSVQHVVHDGGSKDETTTVLSRYGDTVEWVSEADSGQSDALNKAFAKAEGRWIAWLNADEFYLPSGLLALYREGERARADLVYGDSVWVDERGRMLRLVPQHRFSERTLRLYGCFISSSSMIFRRDAVEHEPWDRQARMMMDWELYLRLASSGARFRYVKYPVGAFRRHDQQVTAEPSRFAHEYDEFFERYSINPSHRRWGRWLHRGGKVMSGAYRREFVAKRLVGSDLRWFDDQDARRSCRRLLQACYNKAEALR